MPYLKLANGGGVLMLMILSMVCSAFGEDLSSAGLPRMHKLPLKFNDSQQVESLRSPHGGRELSGTGTFTSRRIQFNSECTNKDISIFQGPDGFYNSIPQFSVQITNNCLSCAPWDIHVFCGWFASWPRMVNRNCFKRIGFNDCLVNGGKALTHGQTLSFTNTNTFMYPLRFKSARFCK